MTVTFKDIVENYGVLNDLSPPDGLSGNRRTLSPTDALSAVLEQAYTPNAMDGKSEFTGIVMATLPTTQPTFTSFRENIKYLDSLSFNQEESSDLKELFFTYKVYIPEIDPRNIIEPNGKTSNGLTFSQRINTLPTAVLAVSDGLSEANQAIVPGTLVDIRFANEKRFLNPKIVRIGGKAFNINYEQGTAAAAFGSNGPITLLGPNGLAPLNSARRRGQDKAIALKNLRKQIFESVGDEALTAPSGAQFSSKTARGGLGGPLDRKVSSSWESNAILNESVQQQLKTKFKTQIDEMLKILGMPPETFERILSKESGIFDPYAINNNTGATGLIQFMPKTATDLGTTVENLLTMGPEKQLKFVEKYFSKLKGSRIITDADQGVDWYFLVFYPAAIGKKPGYVIGGDDPAAAASVNPGYRDKKNQQQYITRRSVIAAWKRQ